MNTLHYGSVILKQYFLQFSYCDVLSSMLYQNANVILYVGRINNTCFIRANTLKVLQVFRGFCKPRMSELSPKAAKRNQFIFPIVSIVYYILSHKNIFNFPTYKHRKLVHLQIFNCPNSYKKKNTVIEQYTRRSIITRTACTVCMHV